MIRAGEVIADPSEKARSDLVGRIRRVNTLLAHYALAVEGGAPLSAGDQDGLTNALCELVQAITQNHSPSANETHDRSQWTEGRMTTADQEVVARGRATISQSFGFSASHELTLLPVDHKCRRNHGHNYTVTATALALDGVPADLSLLGDYLADTFDHRLLNEHVPFHPTSELLARHLAEWFRDNIEATTPISLVEMVVSETASTGARCDGATGEITISKTFKTGLGDVTLVLGADGVDDVGFITDFGHLKPFAAHLHAPATGMDSWAAGPPRVAGLAAWFIENIEPEIRGRLESVRIDTATSTRIWERGDAS